MKTHSLIALAAFVSPLPRKRPSPASTATKPIQTVPVAATAAPQKTVCHSQQEKMRECNKQATGKKGPERRAFMKTCLSKKKA